MKKPLLSRKDKHDLLVKLIDDGRRILAGFLAGLVFTVMPAVTATVGGEAHADADANDRVCACGCCADDDGDKRRQRIERFLETLDERSADALADLLFGTR